MRAFYPQKKSTVIVSPVPREEPDTQKGLDKRPLKELVDD